MQLAYAASGRTFGLTIRTDYIDSADFRKQTPPASWRGFHLKKNSLTALRKACQAKDRYEC